MVQIENQLSILQRKDDSSVHQHRELGHGHCGPTADPSKRSSTDPFGNLAPFGGPGEGAGRAHLPEILGAQKLFWLWRHQCEPCLRGTAHRFTELNLTIFVFLYILVARNGRIAHFKLFCTITNVRETFKDKARYVKFGNVDLRGASFCTAKIGIF